MEIEGWLDRAASHAPGLTAVQTPTGALSYSELRGAAHAGAAELTRLGVSAGDRVALALASGLAFAQALHACLLLGAVAVPLDLRLAPAERARIEGGATVVVDEPLPVSWGSELGPVRQDLAATALVLYTSGTTAAPRPVELTYGNLLWSAIGSGVALGVDPRERWLCALPLSHVGGLSILLRSAIYGTTAVLHERFETDRVLATLMAGEATVVSLVATTLTRLLDAGLRSPPSLRCALTGGGPVSPSLLGRAREAGVPVSLTYGLTETCSQVTTTPIAEQGADEPASAPPMAGPPLFCTNVRIAGDGEILIAGPTVAPSAQLRDGWLQTGDLGLLDEHGRLQVSGRKADTIVSGGENVSPVEVEAVLEAHPAVKEAAVLGREDREWGEAVAAIVVVDPSVNLRAADLRAHCARSLASFKVPKSFRLTAEPLPRTASGKLLRRELA
jgi:o-succinylbenzoate---CoA ligase